MIPGVVVVEPAKHEDDRGSLIEHEDPVTRRGSPAIDQLAYVVHVVAIEARDEIDVVIRV